MKRALITGVTGQDGAYLSELLLNKGYEVHGIKRRTSLFNTQRIDSLFDPGDDGPKLHLHHGDLTDSSSLMRIIQEVQPDEIYNLGAQSHVKVSFEEPEYSANTDALGTLRLLEALRILGMSGTTRFYQASTSEMFGLVQETPQKETTPFYPRSPYGVAKLYAYWIVVNYREAYDMFACNGILFNHESPMRGETFVTRKITRAVARIALGTQDKLLLGNLDALRDWGHARDFVEAMWLMLQHECADDYVVATGVQHTVREFAELAFRYAGIELDWSGRDAREIALDRKSGKVVLEVSPTYYRPTEVESLLGDSTKARTSLGWEPKVAFQDLVREMVEADLQDAKREQLVRSSGYTLHPGIDERS